MIEKNSIVVLIWSSIIVPGTTQKRDKSSWLWLRSTNSNFEHPIGCLETKDDLQKKEWNILVMQFPWIDFSEDPNHRPWRYFYHSWLLYFSNTMLGSFNQFKPKKRMKVYFKSVLSQTKQLFYWKVFFVKPAGDNLLRAERLETPQEDPAKTPPPQAY